MFARLFYFLSNKPLDLKVNSRVNKCLFYGKKVNMACLYPNKKNGKIVSFKFKVFIGRNEDGKQQFKCKTWTPPKEMTPQKLFQMAEKHATLWEDEIIRKEKEKAQKAEPLRISFADFAEKIWLINEIENNEHRKSTVVFNANILKVIVEFFQDIRLCDVTSSFVESYLDYLKNIKLSNKNKHYSPKTQRHHYATLKLIFNYAQKMKYINNNPKCTFFHITL